MASAAAPSAPARRVRRGCAACTSRRSRRATTFRTSWLLPRRRLRDPHRVRPRRDRGGDQALGQPAVPPLRVRDARAGVRALIDVSLLAAEEVAWLDEFHARCRAELSAELLRDAAGADDPECARTLAWLHRETEPMRRSNAAGSGRRPEVFLLPILTSQNSLASSRCTLLTALASLVLLPRGCPASRIRRAACAPWAVPTPRARGSPAWRAPRAGWPPVYVASATQR